MKLTSHLVVALVAGLALSAAALVVAAAASAKEPTGAQVCGLDETCAPMHDRAGVESITNFSSPSEPPPTAPFYRLDFVYESPDGHDRNAFSHLFVPSRNLIAAGGEVEGTIVWFPATGEGLALIRRSIVDLEPFAPPAAWPRSIDDPMFSPRMLSSARDAGGGWIPWLVALAAAVVAVAAFVVFETRLRMRQATAAGLVILVALVVPVAASAKGGLSSARLCGAEDCTPLNDTHSVMTILGGDGAQPPPTDRYYRVDVTFDGQVTHSYLYVPSARLVAAEGRSGDVVWYPARGPARELMARAGRNLQPFTAPAQWPSSFADPIFTRSAPAAAEESTNWASWFIGAAIVALAAVAVFGRRTVALRLSQEP